MYSTSTALYSVNPECCIGVKWRLELTFERSYSGDAGRAISKVAMALDTSDARRSISPALSGRSSPVPRASRKAEDGMCVCTAVYEEPDEADSMAL